MKHSIRRHLLTYLALALTVSSVLIGTLTYKVVSDEIEEWFDENMRQVAQALSAKWDQNAISQTLVDDHRTITQEEVFLIQIWGKGQLPIYTSHPSLSVSRHLASGFGQTNLQGSTWRYYSQTTDGVTVQVSHPLSEREVAKWEVASRFLIPLLLQFPLLGLFIWITVRKGLKPLDVVSADIEKRGSDAMHPLPFEDIPSEIRPLVNALNDLLQRLDEALQAQRRFTADAAHELRTPLTAVQLQLDVLKRCRSEEETADAMDKLSRGVKRSVELVRQLLTLARQDPGSNKQVDIQVDLVSLVEDQLNQCRERATQKGIVMSFMHAKSHVSIMGNPKPLGIMLENLLDNCLRYTPEQGRVEVNLSEQKGTVVIQIRDNGPGIPENEMAHVFERFYRVNGTDEPGNGLGLAIVKQVAEQHGATIILSDGLDGRGLAVTVTFEAVN